MHNPSFSLILLSLFVSKEKANEILGDLIEQSHSHNKAWFITQILRTTCSLLFHAVYKMPIAFSCIGISLCLFVFFLEWWVMQPVTGFIFEKATPHFSIEHSVIITIGSGYLTLMILAFVTGLVSFKIVPRAGIQIPIVASLLFVIIQTTFGLYTQHQVTQLSFSSAIYWTIFGLGIVSLTVTLPLTIGATLANSKRLQSLA